MLTHFSSISSDIWGGGGGATTKKIMPQGKSQDVLCLFVEATPPRPPSSCHILCSINLDSKLCRRRFTSVVHITYSHVLIAKFLTIKVSILSLSWNVYLLPRINFFSVSTYSLVRIKASSLVRTAPNSKLPEAAGKSLACKILSTPVLAR